MSDAHPDKRQGPLVGIKVLEFAGLGPTPYCGMLLSDLGADVVRIDRDHAPKDRFDVLGRGRRSIVLDLKNEADLATARGLAARADILIEGFRPGVMERLGLGPDLLMTANAALVYGRMTGWGQTGPLANAAGHDINYIAISGALHAIGTPDTPVPPLNLVGDMGGGGLFLALGVLAAHLEARQSGLGQVVDCAMAEGAASLMSMFYGLRAQGKWSNARGENLGDGGSHFYNSYRCADGEWIAVGAIEPKFYAQLVQAIGLDAPPPHMDERAWPQAKMTLAEVFLKKTREEWCAALESTDACFAPVLNMDEAPRHRQNLARQSFVEIDGVAQPAPTPKFSRSPGRVAPSLPSGAETTQAIMRDWGVT